MLKLHRDIGQDLILNFVNIFITRNRATISGDAIYGGLFDRCSVSPQAEVMESTLNALDYIKKIVNFANNLNSSVSSEPVQVRFCDSKTTIYIKKGESFTVNITAIDQVGNSVNATIHASVITKSGVGRLKEGQAKQIVGNQCTELKYNVFAQDTSAKLQLYADGPCTNSEISKKVLNISFQPCSCSIGLQPSQSKISCECVCDPKLQPYQITNCSQKAGTIRLENNTTYGYVGWKKISLMGQGTSFMNVHLITVYQNQSTSVSTAPRRETDSVPLIEVVSCVVNVDKNSVLCWLPQNVKSAQIYTLFC